MFSISKHEDKKFLMELLELIQTLIRLNTTQTLDLAEQFGDHYVALEKKIQTYDYSKDDELFT